MTDNRTTERLRALLDERGVEYTTDDGKYLRETCWAGELMATFVELENGETRFELNHLHFTPEQAIAATLGGGTLTAEQVREAIEHNFGKVAVIDDGGEKVEWREGWVCNVGFNSQAIADELNAKLGRGTCKIKQHRCTACGREINDYAYFVRFDLGNGCWESRTANFCPSCGCEVER